MYRPAASHTLHKEHKKIIETEMGDERWNNTETTTHTHKTLTSKQNTQANFAHIHNQQVGKGQESHRRF